MKTIYVSFFFLTAVLANAQPQVTPISISSEAIASADGDLANGAPMEDLTWAWSSSNACFVETQKKKFTGHHVLFATDLPPYSELTVTLIPEDPNANFSLYGYSIGTTRTDIVPNLPSCVTCEADFKWDYPYRGRTQDHTRSIRFNAIRNPYRVIIGVAGAEGLATGKFRLEVKLDQ